MVAGMLCLGGVRRVGVLGAGVLGVADCELWEAWAASLCRPCSGKLSLRQTRRVRWTVEWTSVMRKRAWAHSSSLMISDSTRLWRDVACGMK